MLANSFLTASRALKNPKLRLVTATGRKVVLSRCGMSSRTPGEISMTDGRPFGSNTYYGRITPQGRAYWRNIPDSVLDEVKALLKEFEADPKAAMLVQGTRTGSCCICGRELTDPESVALGIGPICGGRWGL